MSDFNLETFLPYQLAVLSARLSKGFAKHYRDRFGITVSEWRVIAHLSQAQAVSVREICARVDLEKPRVSRAAARLEAAGFVEKRTNPRDRRLIEISLTEKGRLMMQELTPIAHAYEAKLAAALGQDSATFRGLMKTLDGALDIEE